MDEGVVAGTGNAVARVIAIIKEQGPHLGLFIKDSKCELFSKCNLNSFPLQMKRSNTANLVLLHGGSNWRPDFLCKIHLKSSLQDP